MSDKTLSQILDAVKDGAPAEDDDLRCALLAMESLWVFLNMDLRGHASGTTRMSLDWTHKEAFGRNKRALNASPRKWLGSNVPENPDWQKRRKIAEGLLDKAIKGELG